MIKNMTLSNVRCFTKKNLSFDQSTTYIYGMNGSGKTTILEAIHMISNGRSHRTNEDKNMILKDAPFGKIKLETHDHHTYEVVITPKGKRVWLDHQEIKKLSKFVGHLKSVLFSPEDIDLVKGTPQFKRQFLDVSMMQVDPSYIETLNVYKKILKQRNALLKKIGRDQDLTFLNILSEQLSEYGKIIIEKRALFLETLNGEFQTIYQTFNSAKVYISYKPNVDVKNILNTMIKNKDTDMILKTTTTGPQRDDIQVMYNESEAKEKTSQGQQRLIAIAMKLAVLEHIKKTTQKPVVLLLDDVLSELDQEKQELILSYQQENQQTIINSAIPKDIKIGTAILLEGEHHE